MNARYWDAQIAHNGQWVSLYSGPFECLEDAHEVIELAIEDAKRQGENVVTRIVELEKIKE